MKSLTGALLLFIGGAIVGGFAGTLLLVLSFLALAGALLALLSPIHRAPERVRSTVWEGPRSLDELLVREEIGALGLDAPASEELAGAARALARERGVDPLAAARAIAEAVAGDPRDLALLGWPLREGLSRGERILELRSRR